MSKNQSQKNPRKPAEPRKPAKPQPNLWPPIAALAILAYGLYRAIDLRWICDDAFITMRYVKNFVEGNGLVYNVGERVEGYTHFLWLMILAASQAIGFDPVDASMWLGIASYAGILVLLLAISFREHKKNPKALWLPLAAALFALNYDTAEWASGGLETSFYTLLILGAFYLWFYSRFSEKRRLLLAGITLTLVSLTRPDGVLFTATAVVLLAISGIKRKQSVRSISKSIGIIVLPSFVIGVPYLVWKYFYYGDILPLTYYAKSANENYFDQGFFYIWLYFRVYFISGIAFIAGAIILLYPRKDKRDAPPANASGTPWLTAFIAMVMYLILFVARVGGDFMFARFIIPVVPFVYFIIERAADKISVKMLKYRTGIAIILLCSFIAESKVRDIMLFHHNQGKMNTGNWDLIGAGSTRGIADERWSYYYGKYFHGDMTFGPMYIYSRIGESLEPYFEGLPIAVAIPGGKNMIAYYANFSNAVNEYGLTDSAIAHLALADRARIGHEKIASEKYLESRNVDIALGEVVSKLPDPFPLNQIAFEIPEFHLWLLGRTIAYHKGVADSLYNRFRATGSETIIPCYEKMIPYYIQNLLPLRPLDRLEEDYRLFQTMYFHRYTDTAVERPFEARIAELKLDSIKKKTS